MRIGIMGGTFDPIHLGHLAAAEEAKTKARLDEVIFMPARQPWMKEGTAISAPEHRVKMVRLAIEGKPGFKVSNMELDRPGLTYTVDTLTELIKTRPEDEFHLIIGWGSLSEMTMWHAPHRIIAMCKIIAVPRPGASRPDLKSLDAVIPGIMRKVKLLDRPFMDISATEIRDRASCGMAINFLVPRAVEKYILEHDLYSSEKEGKK